MKTLFLIFVICLGASVRRVEGQDCCAFSPVLGSCTSLGACNSNCCDCDNECRAKESYTDPTGLRQHWMSNILNNVPIDEISIPGTRLSSSYILQPSSANALVKTQSLDITAQLNAGIRYLDLRVRHENNQFVMQHGAVSLSFTDLLIQMTAFLDMFRTETVLIRLSKESEAYGNTRSFVSTLNAYIAGFGSFFWTFDQNTRPSLNMVRRKIVILKDFDGADGQFIDFNSFNVQDVSDLSYGQNGITKLDAITAQFNAARQPNAARIVNYLSGSSSSNQISPKDLAEWTNPHFIKLTNDNDASYVGIVPADFPTDSLIATIIRTNNRKLKRRGNTLESGEILYAYEYLISPNGGFGALLRDDGNFVVIFADDGTVVWESEGTNSGNYVLYMQPDGDLVTYKPGWIPTWSSNTARTPNPNYKLILTNGARLNIIDPVNNGIVWGT